MLGGFEGHEPGDRLGWATATGDFDGDGSADTILVARDDERRATYGPDFANPTECAGALGTSGAAWVYSSTNPTFVVHGSQVLHRFEVADSGFDHDGDGFDDLVLGAFFADGRGSFTLVRGRPASPDGITVICDAEHHFGVTANSRLGVAVAGVGDLDGDGCDEIAVGADTDDLGGSNQGSLRIWWGHGATCASASPEVTTLVTGTNNDRLGTAVAGERDADGDGVPDVVVAATDAHGGAIDAGAIWLLSGDWIAGLARQPGPSLPANNATVTHLLPTDRRLAGSILDGDFGSDVALVPDPTDAALALVAVGHRFGSEGGVDQSGGVGLYRWTDQGFDPEPVAIVAGETDPPGGQLGAGLQAHPTLPLLAVGAPLSDAAALDGGAIYPIRLTP